MFPRMNFDLPKEVPGNIAGDVGKDQLSCSVGALPSPFNDNRTLKGDLTLDLDPATDTLTVTSDLTYVVKDTIDLCPGDCGTSLEQVATVSISRWEATGISGDVPFTVKFDSGLSPFDVRLKGPPPREAPPSPPPPKKASAEICRAKKDAPVVVATDLPGNDRIVKLPEGSRVEVIARTKARLADGTETTWLRVKMLDGPEPGTIGRVRVDFVQQCAK